MAQAGQYFVLPERARMPVPQTSQRRSFFGLRMACSSFGCWGSTARRNQPAEQASRDVLRADTVQQQAVAIREVAAALCKTAHAAELPRRQAKSEPSGSRSMGSSLCIFALLCDELCIRRVVQRNEGGLAQALLFSDNQAAVLQFPEDPRGALAAAVEFGLRLF